MQDEIPLGLQRVEIEWAGDTVELGQISSQIPSQFFKCALLTRSGEGLGIRCQTRLVCVGILHEEAFSSCLPSGTIACWQPARKLVIKLTSLNGGLTGNYDYHAALSNVAIFNASSSTHMASELSRQDFWSARFDW